LGGIPRLITDHSVSIYRINNRHQRRCTTKDPRLGLKDFQGYCTVSWDKEGVLTILLLSWERFVPRLEDLKWLNLRFVLYRYVFQNLKSKGHQKDICVDNSAKAYSRSRSSKKCDHFFENKAIRKKGVGIFSHVLHVYYSFHQKCSKLDTFTA
jgi:hypothetical protein